MTWEVKITYEVNGSTVTDKIVSDTRPSIQIMGNGVGSVRTGETPDDNVIIFAKCHRIERGHNP